MPQSAPRIAVIALQGDYDRHIARLKELGADAFAARFPDEVDSAEGVVLPGGESTTICKLLARYKMDAALRRAAVAKRPIYGTCAGMIVLAKAISDNSAEQGGQETLGLLDIDVSRNAFGRQIDSFEAELDASSFGEGGEVFLRAVFIRAPIVTRTGPRVSVLARYDGRVVFVQEGLTLASSFHPELTDDTRVHQYFLSLVPSRS